MFGIKAVLVAFVVCVLGVAAGAQNAAPDAAGPLVITAVPDATTVHPGDALKFDVAIKNVSKDEQRIDVPNIVWAAATDVPAITIPGWPARGGIGPAVTYQSVAIAPGETYKRTWSANVSATAEVGDVTLRVGVPLKRGGERTWSAPVKLTIAAKEAAANPLYAAWKGQEGKTATYTRMERISGGAPIPGGGERAATMQTVVFTASKITADQAEITVTTGANTPAETLAIPATIMPDDPAYPKPAGTEELKIGDKTFACTKYTYTTNSRAEMGRDGQGLRGRVTVWVADGVPGGIVQRKISLTIRVTYDITDTLQTVLSKN